MRDKKDYVQNDEEEQEALISKMKETSGTSKGTPKNTPVQGPQGASNKLRQYESEQEDLVCN